jgi:hypothetical protein
LILVAGWQRLACSYPSIPPNYQLTCTPSDQCPSPSTCQSGCCVNPGDVPHCSGVDGGTCTPQCGGKQCGSDGCTGTCGTCSAGKSCSNGSCLAGPPACPSACPTGENCPVSTGVCSCGAAGQACSAADQTFYRYGLQCVARSGGGDTCAPRCGTCPTGTACNSSLGVCDCVDSAGTNLCTGGLYCGSGECGKDNAGCAQATGQCAAGFTCLTTTGDYFYCYRPCSTAADCPLPTQACGVLSGSGSTQSFCAGVSCTPWGACQMGSIAGFCLPDVAAGTSGYCADVGDAPIGGDCNAFATRRDGLGSMCVSGAICLINSDVTNSCYRVCNLSGGSPACPSGQACHSLGASFYYGYCQ